MKYYIRKASVFIRANFYSILTTYLAIILTVYSFHSFFIPSLCVFFVFSFFLMYNFFFVTFKMIKCFFLKLSILNYVNNIKIDIDNTTNTDGEDLLSYLNDFTEISLQDRAYFFDWIFTNPFEFVLYSSLSYIFVNLILKGFQRVTISVFKFLKK